MRGVQCFGILVAFCLILISLHYSLYSTVKPWETTFSSSLNRTTIISDTEDRYITDAVMDVMSVSESTNPSEAISSTSTEKSLAIKSSAMNEEIYGIMNTKPIQFLPNFKNPCWYGSSNNGPINDNKLHCLPFFYILGVKKSGTTDLFTSISAHPEFAYAGFKEARWFPNRISNVTRRNLPKKVAKVLKGKDARRLDYYVSMYDIAAQKIKEHPSKTLSNTMYYKLVTADGTPSTLNKQSIWDKFPGNEGLEEPRYTTFHYIKHLVPDAKILIIFRDPVERFYSDYTFGNGIPAWKRPGLSPQTLHERIQFEVETFEKCFQQYSMRRCIYNQTLFNHSAPEMKYKAFSFNGTFYAFYMKELLSVFRKDQIFPILMLDYIQDTKATMAKVFNFLGLSKLDNRAMNDVLNHRVQQENSKNKNQFGPMLEKTKELLRTFLRPFNEEMAELMNDSRYLFQPAAV